MVKDTFIYHQDPGHGWIAVKRALIQQLGIADAITSYSYQRGATVYLEEDLDASSFETAYTAKFGKPPMYDRRHTNNSSPIRSYECYEETKV